MKIPSQVLGLCTAAGRPCPPPSVVLEMALWLGYASSTINPLIYTVFNVKFRKSFIRLLLCKNSVHSFSMSNNNSASFWTLFGWFLDIIHNCWWNVIPNGYLDFQDYKIFFLHIILTFLTKHLMSIMDLKWN